MAMRHGRGADQTAAPRRPCPLPGSVRPAGIKSRDDERPNVSRSAVENGEAARETKRRQPLPEGAFHRAGSETAFTTANVPLKQRQMNDL